MDTKTFESPNIHWAKVDEQGRLVLPAEIAVVQCLHVGGGRIV